MIDPKYRSQVKLLLDILPSVADESRFALHGGTAINLFANNMPRLSVDLDLTYIPLEDRITSLANITTALASIKQRALTRLSPIRITHQVDKAKLICTRQAAQVKIEVNTIMRGTLGMALPMVLAPAAQEKFTAYAEIQIAPVGQLYGGKICAALDRQHPRDLFDVDHLYKTTGITPEIKRGFLFCMLCGDGPLDEFFKPNLFDRRETMKTQFAGMTDQQFTYDEFEGARNQLIHDVNTNLSNDDRKFLISFLSGNPAYSDHGFSDFEKYPAIQWKLQNIKKLKSANPTKHQLQLKLLAENLNIDP